MQLFGVEGAKFNRPVKSKQNYFSKSVPPTPSKTNQEGSEAAEEEEIDPRFQYIEDAFKRMNKEKEKEKELAARRPEAKNKKWHNGVKLPPRESTSGETFLKLPANFMSAETSMIFDNFQAIKDGSDIGKRKVEEIKRDYLHCK